MTSRRPTAKKSGKHAARRRSTKERKDRLIQTRVAADLDRTLKEEAERRRLTVSHLIRSILEDTFHLVDDVVSDLDRVVTDSVGLARNVRRNARRLAAPTKAPPAANADWERGLDDIYGWSELLLQRDARCRRCSETIERGQRGFVGVSDKPRRARVWLCRHCMESL